MARATFCPNFLDLSKLQDQEIRKVQVFAGAWYGRATDGLG